MNVWMEPSSTLQDAAVTDTTDGAWERLDAAETVGIAATCAARLGKGDLVLLEAPLGERGSRTGTWTVIRDFARRYKVSEDTVDQYRRISGWYGPDRRSALKATGAVASYSLLRDVALHTFGSATEPDVRFAALVAALAEAAHDSRGRATRQDYLRHLGLDSETTSARDPALDQFLQHIKELLRDGHRSGDGLRPQRTGPPSC
ncbi:hypothetical protein [Streptomyces sp. NPDC088755]|uniref:hypothetical protein n=1 Tax=Streptomyces sp. NPDC088755 TaxID=3365888 RepID=UPI0037FC48A9